MSSDDKINTVLDAVWKHIGTLSLETVDMNGAERAAHQMLASNGDGLDDTQKQYLRAYGEFFLSKAETGDVPTNNVVDSTWNNFKRNVLSMKYRDKNELKLLLRFQISGDATGASIKNGATMMRMLKNKILEGRLGEGKVGAEEDAAFEKFIRVLFEFGEFLEKNSLVIDANRQNERDDIIDRFVEYIYPGDANPGDGDEFKRFKSKRKYANLDGLENILGDHIELFKEMAIDPGAYYTVKDLLKEHKRMGKADRRAKKNIRVAEASIVSSIRGTQMPPPGVEELQHTINNHLEPLGFQIDMKGKVKGINGGAVGGDTPVTAIRSMDEYINQFQEALKQDPSGATSNINVEELENSVKARVIAELPKLSEPDLSQFVNKNTLDSAVNSAIKTKLSDDAINNINRLQTVIADKNKHKEMILKSLLALTGTDKEKQDQVKELKDYLQISSSGEMQGGGAPADPVKIVAEVEALRLELRNVMDSLSSAKTQYVKNIKQYVDIEQPQGETEQITAADKRYAGDYTALKNNGGKILEEIKAAITNSKTTIQNIQTRMQAIYNTNPENKLYIASGRLLKKVLQGDLDITPTDDRRYKGILSVLSRALADVQTNYNKALNNLQKYYDLAERDLKAQKYNNQNVLGLLRRGGVGDGSNTNKNDDNIEPDIQFVVDRLNDEFVKELKKLEAEYARKSNPLMVAATGEPSMFSNLYNQYLSRKSEVGSLMAAEELSEDLSANSMLPREVLAVTAFDKVVFVFITLFIRLFALSIVSVLIEKGKLSRMNTALGVFLGFYILIYLVIVALVNIDVYRMRIIFNYINFHGNSGLIFGHLGLLLLFSLLIYIIMMNINFPIKGLKILAVTEEEKTSLIYRLEVLTMIIWVFLVFMVVIM